MIYHINSLLYRDVCTGQAGAPLPSPCSRHLMWHVTMIRSWHPVLTWKHSSPPRSILSTVSISSRLRLVCPALAPLCTRQSLIRILGCSLNTGGWAAHARTRGRHPPAVHQGRGCASLKPCHAVRMPLTIFSTTEILFLQTYLAPLGAIGMFV